MSRPAFLRAARLAAVAALLAGCGESFATGPDRFPAALDVRNWSDTLVVGERRAVTVRVLDERSREVLDRTVQWSVAAPSIVRAGLAGASATASASGSGSFAAAGGDSVVVEGVQPGASDVTLTFADALFEQASVTRRVTVVTAGVRLATAADTTLTAVGDTAVIVAQALGASRAGGTEPVAGLGVTWTRRGPGAVALVGQGDTVRVVALQDGADTLLATHPACRSGGGCADTVVVHVVTALPVTLSLTTAEKIVGGTQQFSVTSGESGPFVWSVDGVDGGSAASGTITDDGLYTAPASVPAGGSVQVCVRIAGQPSTTACATVTIVATPSAGADVIVFNDVNVTADDGWSGGSKPENRVFFENLVSFTGSAPRVAGRSVMFYTGASSVCGVDCATADAPYVAGLGAKLIELGYTVVSENGTLADIPADVKVVFVFTPGATLPVADVNGLKRFAGEGGRVVVVGENQWYMGPEGLAAENQLLSDLGAQLTNAGGCLVPGEYAPAEGTHQLVDGVPQLFMNCVSPMTPGPNDFVLFRATGGEVVGAVAKIDLTPLPQGAPRRAVRPAVRATTARSASPIGR